MIHFIQYFLLEKNIYNKKEKKFSFAIHQKIATQKKENSYNQFTLGITNRI